MTALDIILHQSGEFYEVNSASWAKAIIGPVIAALVALTLYFLKVNYDEMQRKKDKVSMDNQRLHYFTSMTESVIKKNQDQAKYIVDFIKEFKENVIKIPLPTYIAHNDMRRILELKNHQEFYHSYLSKFGYNTVTVTDFRNIFNCLDYIDEQRTTFDLQVERGRKFEYEQKEKYSDYFKELFNNVMQLYHKYNSTNTASDYTEFIKKTIDNYRAKTTDKSDFQQIEDNFITPLRKGLTSDYLNKDQAFDFLTICNMCSSIILNLRHNNQHLLGNTENLSKEYKQATEDLLKYADRLFTQYIKESK